MNFYETIFILGSAPDAIDAEIQKVVDLITANKGQVVHIDRWGMKKFAYEIRKKEQGYYTCVYFKGDKSLPAHLESYYKLNESCLRYLTVVSIHTPEEIASRAEKVEARSAVKAAAAPKPTAQKAEAKTVPKKEKAEEPSEETEAEITTKEAAGTPEEPKTSEEPEEKPKERSSKTKVIEPSAEEPEETPEEAEAAEPSPEQTEGTAEKHDQS